MTEGTEEVAETVEAPEVEASATEAPATEAPATEAAPTETETPTAEAPATEAAPSLPDFDSFDWENWDSKVESLPEPILPWAQRVWDHHQTTVQEQVEAKLQEEAAEIENLRKIYDELIQGNEDPRLAKALAEHTTLQEKYADLEGKYATTAREYEEYVTAIQEQVKLQGQAIADQFRATYPEIFADKTKHALFGELLDENWDLENIPRVMALGEEAMALARKARAEGTPDNYALQLAERVRSKPATPRPGAKLTSGSEGSVPSGEAATPGVGDAKDINDLRSYAIRKAMRTHGSK